MATVAIRHHLRRTGEGIQDFILNWYYACALLFSRSLEKCYGGSSGLLEKELPIPLVLQRFELAGQLGDEGNSLLIGHGNRSFSFSVVD